MSVSKDNQIYNRIIQLHIDGHSMGEIATLIGGISKTSVHNVIHDWKKKISTHDIDEIRFFMQQLRKSGITIADCIEGFRIKQMLGDFEIPDESTDWINGNVHNQNYKVSINPTHNEDSILDSIIIRREEIANSIVTKNSKKPKNLNVRINPVSFFVEVLYKECKNHQINPASAVRWIQDLMYCFSSAEKPTSVDLKGGECIDEITCVKQPTYPRTGSYFITDPNLPLISRVSFFIEQKKEEIVRLSNKKKTIIQEVTLASKEKIKLESEVEGWKKMHRDLSKYSTWYASLKQDLLLNQNLIIDNEIDSFCKAINDFKYYGYHPYRIIAEYKNIDSLRQSKESIRDDIISNRPIRDHLLRQVTDLQNQLDANFQTLTIYNELNSYGLGLRELKRLRQTIIEISNANKLKASDAVKKFLREVEDHYDDKVGFEIIVNKLNSKKKILESEVPEYKNSLLLQALASACLLNLQTNGVTNQDIIDMNVLVSEFRNSDFLSNTINYIDHDLSSTTRSSMNKHDCWSLFIAKLGELKNINHTIINRRFQFDNLNNLFKELKKRNQNLECDNLRLVTSLNHLYRELSKIINLSFYINGELSQKLITKQILTPPLIILIITNDNNKKE